MKKRMWAITDGDSFVSATERYSCFDADDVLLFCSSESAQDFINTYCTDAGDLHPIKLRRVVTVAPPKSSNDD